MKCYPFNMQHVPFMYHTKLVIKLINCYGYLLETSYSFCKVDLNRRGSRAEQDMEQEQEEEQKLKMKQDLEQDLEP